MINNLYIRYPVVYNQIYDVLKKHNAKYVTFFIDLQSIARGLFNKKTVELEIARYAENKYLNTLPNELLNFIENLKEKFKKYDLFFVIFYDDGLNEIHRSILKEYKANRTYSFQDSVYEEIYKKLKKCYFLKIYEFNKFDDISVVYLNKYENDFIPYFVIDNNLLDTKSEENVNIILSVDKDLLQTLSFPNTYQFISSYKQGKYLLNLYSDKNAVKYLYEKENDLTSKYIPLILSIAGDKSDNIKGIKGIGYAKAIKLIKKYDIKPDLSNIDKIDCQIIKDNLKLIKTNYKLISFKEYIKLLPLKVKEFILKHF